MAAKYSKSLNNYRLLFEPKEDSIKYAEVIYFRLKLVDLDGRFDYSKIVFSACAFNSTELAVYPNPVKDAFYIYSKNAETLSGLTLFDVYGKTYLINTHTENKTKIRVEPLDILPGVYYVKYSTTEGVKIFKIIISN